MLKCLRHHKMLLCGHVLVFFFATGRRSLSLSLIHISNNNTLAFRTVSRSATDGWMCFHSIFYRHPSQRMNLCDFNDCLIQADTAAGWLAPLPHREKVHQPAGDFLCGICTFYLWLSGFSPDTLAFAKDKFAVLN